MDIESFRKMVNIITTWSYRNSCIEEYHGGISPTSKTGDYSDVKVVTPYGEIPWKEVSRLNDKEMKRINKCVHDNLFTFILLLSKGHLKVSPFLYASSEWDDANIVEDLFPLVGVDLKKFKKENKDLKLKYIKEENQ